MCLGYFILFFLNCNNLNRMIFQKSKNWSLERWFYISIFKFWFLPNSTMHRWSLIQTQVDTSYSTFCMFLRQFRDGISEMFLLSPEFTSCCIYKTCCTSTFHLMEYRRDFKKSSLFSMFTFKWIALTSSWIFYPVHLNSCLKFYLQYFNADYRKCPKQLLCI